MTSSGRHPLEKLADHLLLLYLINKANQVESLTGDTKLQKLVYLAERNMLGRKLKGFNFFFHRFDYGPYSQELKDDNSHLIGIGLLEKKKWNLTDEGGSILDSFPELWERNRAIVEQIDAIVMYSKWSLSRLKNFVYEQPHPWLKGKTIRSVPKFTPILRKLKSENAEEEFAIMPSEIETIDILLDKEHYGDLLNPPDEDENETSIPFPGV